MLPRVSCPPEVPLTGSLQPLTVLLVRHARTAWNVERRFLGRTDVPLDEAGELQAEALGRRLEGIPLAGVYTSPLRRALDTARRLGAPRPVDALAEMDMGALEGLGPEELHAAFPDLLRRWREDPERIEAPGGETLAGAQARVLAGFRDLVAPHAPGETIVLVTHQIALAALLAGLLGAPIGDYRRYMHRNTGVSTGRWGPRFELQSFDDADHLAALGDLQSAGGSKSRTSSSPGTS